MHLLHYALSTNKLCLCPHNNCYLATSAFIQHFKTPLVSTSVPQFPTVWPDASMHLDLFSPAHVCRTMLFSVLLQCSWIHTHTNTTHLHCKSAHGWFPLIFFYIPIFSEKGMLFHLLS